MLVSMWSPCLSSKTTRTTMREGASEHAALLSNQMEGAKTAPVDEMGSCHLAGTVYGGRILPLPAKRHPRQQRDHLQRPAKIAEIMHFPPRPDLSDSAADPGVMHAVRPHRISKCM